MRRSPPSPTTVIAEHAADLPPHEARRLLETAAGQSWTELLLAGVVGEDEVERFTDLCRRRRVGEPLQYLEGAVAFGPVEVEVDPRVLIPRPETEQLWELAIRLAHPLPDGAVIVDLCTGSGNLALALAHAFPGHTVYATEISPEAASVARRNVAAASAAVEVLVGDLFDPLPRELQGQIGLLTANPPYLAEAELETLPAEVRDHEPHGALVAGPHGDEVLARIAGEAEAWLGDGGVVAVEISEYQQDRATELFAAYSAEVRRDLVGRPRFVVGRAPARRSRARTPLH